MHNLLRLGRWVLTPVATSFHPPTHPPTQRPASTHTYIPSHTHNGGRKNVSGSDCMNRAELFLSLAQKGTTLLLQVTKKGTTLSRHSPRLGTMGGANNSLGASIFPDSWLGIKSCRRKIKRNALWLTLYILKLTRVSGRKKEVVFASLFFIISLLTVTRLKFIPLSEKWPCLLVSTPRKWALLEEEVFKSTLNIIVLKIRNKKLLDLISSN